MAGIQPNNVTLDFTIAHGNGIISIPRALSLLNRRSYRAGYVYSVDYIEFIGAAQDKIRTGYMPLSYTVTNAYKLGFENWLEQRAEAIGETGIVPGRWSDFKPYYSLYHLLGAGAGGFTEYIPEGLQDPSINLGDLSQRGSEWNMAELVRNDPGAATTTTINVGMLGDDDIALNSYGSLVCAMGDTSRATLAPDPLMPTAGSISWITKTGEASSEMTGDVIELIEDENDNPPYANETDVNQPPVYVGNGQSAPEGLLMDMSVTGSTGRPVSLNGGLVPLGYVIFNADLVNEQGVATFRVHCTRGEYKGVAALPMGDFS
jgi:hypothetical protein